MGIWVNYPPDDKLLGKLTGVVGDWVVLFCTETRNYLALIILFGENDD